MKMMERGSKGQEVSHRTESVAETDEDEGETVEGGTTETFSTLSDNQN